MYDTQEDHLRLYCLNAEGVYEGEVWVEEGRLLHRLNEKTGLFLGIDKTGEYGIEGFEVYTIDSETLEFTPAPRTAEIRAYVSALQIANFDKDVWLRP